jgi:hypothetical protein
MKRERQPSQRLPQARRAPLQVIGLTVLERDAVKHRRSSIVLQQTNVIEGVSVFDQVAKQLPFEQWEQLKLQLTGCFSEESYATLYQSRTTVDHAMLAEQLAQCKHVLDVARKDEIFSRAGRGYELVLMKMSKQAQHNAFLQEQTRLWFQEVNVPT